MKVYAVLTWAQSPRVDRVFASQEDADKHVAVLRAQNELLAINTWSQEVDLVWFLEA